MKKLTLIIAAFALLIGFSQCKKEDIPTTENEGVRITLTAGYGQNGQRTGFNPNGTFVWSNTTEYINVGGKRSGYLGQLTGTGNGTDKISFSGTINTPAADEETLYFFYLGNGDHKEATTLDFSNQYGDLDRITNWHVAIGAANYIGEGSYNVTLDMAMAIAYFDVSGFTNVSNTLETVYIHGDEVYSTATINYNDGTITGASKGYIRLGNEIGNPQKYVALIPSTTSETTLSFDSESKTGSMTFLRGIQAGKYYSNGDNALSMTVDAGAGIPGTFSVSATKKVFFSKGNLQYQASTGTWRFAENQYDAIGNNAGNNNFTETRSTQSDWIDLFGWGTSGWDGASAYTVSHYQPWAYLGNSPSNTYGYGYGPSTKEGNSYNYTYSLTGTYANCDWGVYNTISEDGTGWRTLTGGDDDSSEWKYLLQTRNASTVAGTDNARFFKAKVNNIQGIVILPDVYSHPDGISNPAYINQTSYLSWSNVSSYNQTQWDAMETAGAVFLPMGGYRSYSSNNPGYTSGYGYYWSTTVKSNSDAYNMQFTTGLSYSGIAKRTGCSVRLVKDVE